MTDPVSHSGEQFSTNVSNISGDSSPTPAPPWVAPPIDAWAIHYWKLMSLFICYIISFIFGQLVNWTCLMNINRTNLNACARYLMTLQCFYNTIYITVNFPYKAAILFLQRTFLPLALKIVCGWLHLWVIFGTIFLQVMAVTRVIYIIFPQVANQWFSTRRASLAPCLVPIIFGCLYSFPALHPCCYRFYKFTSYTMSYVGYNKEIQLQFSIVATSLLIFMLITCYTAISIKIKKSSRAVATEKQREHRKDAKKETRVQSVKFQLALLFAMTGCIWFVYLVLFYSIYWSGLFTPYSLLALFSEMLEQVLYFIDPVAYIIMSSDLRRSVLKSFGFKVPPSSVHYTHTAAPTNGRITARSPRKPRPWDHVQQGNAGNPGEPANLHPRSGSLVPDGYVPQSPAANVDEPSAAASH